MRFNSTKTETKTSVKLGVALIFLGISIAAAGFVKFKLPANVMTLSLPDLAITDVILSEYSDGALGQDQLDITYGNIGNADVITTSTVMTVYAKHAQTGELYQSSQFFFDKFLVGELKYQTDVTALGIPISDYLIMIDDGNKVKESNEKNNRYWVRM